MGLLVCVTVTDLKSGTSVFTLAKRTAASNSTVFVAMAAPN